MPTKRSIEIPVSSFPGGSTGKGTGAWASAGAASASSRAIAVKTRLFAVMMLCFPLLLVLQPGMASGIVENKHLKIIRIAQRLRHQWPKGLMGRRVHPDLLQGEALIGKFETVVDAGRQGLSLDQMIVFEDF